MTTVSDSRPGTEDSLKAIVLFASITCNTEEIADLLATGLGEAGVTTEVKQIFAVDAAELSGYDIVALGSYTWMEGELADECLALYHALDTVDLSGKLGLAFGSCDAAYSPYRRGGRPARRQVAQPRRAGRRAAQGPGVAGSRRQGTLRAGGSRARRAPRRLTRPGPGDTHDGDSARRNRVSPGRARPVSCPASCRPRSVKVRPPGPPRHPGRSRRVPPAATKDETRTTRPRCGCRGGRDRRPSPPRGLARRCF